MKMNDYMNGRNDGLVLALKIVHEGGVEALEKEMKFRNITQIHTGLATKDLDKASDAIKDQTFDCMLTLMIATLHDEFGFGQARCQRVIDRFTNKTECMMKGLSDWPDMLQCIKDELKLDLEIRYNN